ncbi:hypothetical protein SDC9_163786 [bioreactor metagenome]|uniref:Uncharacterized protein n=1 Tax=bioreactor metagenome TaxID=1076179 RepID=A0A645FRV2_9ZZZZ
MVDSFQNHIRTKVAREDQNRVFEVHSPALPVCNAPVVEHLQEHVQHVRVRFFHLIEQYHGVRLLTNRFGQHAAFTVADIARW